MNRVERQGVRDEQRWHEQVAALRAELDSVRQALRDAEGGLIQARADLVGVAREGFDWHRGEMANDALTRIDLRLRVARAALSAVSPSERESESETRGAS